MNGTTELLGTASFPLTGNFLAGRLRHNLSLDDLQYIEGLVESVEEHDDGARLLSRGIKTDRSTILIEGYIFRTIESGNKRFITGVHVPGDFVDLHGFALKRLDHNIDAAGKVKVGSVSHCPLYTFDAVADAALVFVSGSRATYPLQLHIDDVC
mgnify:CR=1 FL=1